MRLAALALSCLAAIPAVAHADSFLYTFNSTNLQNTFLYSSPTLLTADTTFQTPFCTYDGGACNLTELNPVSGSIIVGYELNGDGGYLTNGSLPASSFTLGTHTDPSRYGFTLTVQQVAAFLYTYNAPGQHNSFTYSSPTLLMADTTISPQTCTYGGGACNVTEIDPVSGSIVVGYELNGNGSYSSNVSLPASAFTPGTYTDPSRYGFTLTVAAIPVASPVPEPSSLALLGTGVLGAIGLIRRRLA